MNHTKIAYAACGALLGRSLLTVKIENIDLTFNEKKEKDPEANRLIRPFKKYMIEPINVTSVEASTDIENRAIVIFNKKSEMQFVVAEGIVKPDNDSVREAIEAAVNGHTRFFSGEDYPALFSIIDQVNAKNMTEINNLAQDLIKQGGFLKELRKVQADNYRKEMEDYNSTL